MWDDPIVAEVRRIREELAAKFNFDVAAIFADLRRQQAKSGDRLVNREHIAQQIVADDEAVFAGAATVVDSILS